MTTLNKDWLTEKTFDVEYKKYILLGYLQSVNKDFQHLKLYPALSDLVEHYKNIILIKENATQLQALFKKEIKKIDWENFKIVYESSLKKAGVLEALEEIIEFSIPFFKSHLEDGKKLYHEIEKYLHIEPLGVLPLHYNEGYLLLKEKSAAKTHAYQYSITIYDEPSGRYKAINTTFVSTYTLSIKNTLDTIKTDLIKRNGQIPNPATFCIESNENLPLNETLLPIAKRVLIKYTSVL